MAEAPLIEKSGSRDPSLKERSESKEKSSGQIALNKSKNPPAKKNMVVSCEQELERLLKRDLTPPPIQHPPEKVAIKILDKSKIIGS